MKWLLCALTLGASILVVTGHAANPRDPYDPSVKADLYYACADEIKLAEATSPQTAWFRYAWAHQFKNFQQPGIFFDKLKKETRPQWIPFHYLYACASVTYIVQQKNGVGSGKEALTQWRKLRSYFDQKYMAGKPSLYPAPSSRAESSPDQRTSPTTIAIAPTGSAETPGAVNQPEADAERERKEARRRQRREAWAALKPAVDDTANRNPNKARKLATLEALTAKPTDGDNRVSKALNLYAENLERRYPNTAGNSPSGSGTGTGVSPARQMESTGSPSAANRTGGYTSPGNMPSREIAACDSDIKNKQLESRNWSGDANERANRLGRYQKQLFEGRCAGHPQAHAYIAGANRMLGYRRDESTSASTSSGQSTSGGSSSGSTNSEVRDFPAPDRNHCLRVVESTRGGQCNSRSSALVRVKNVCPEKIKMHLCVWDTRNNRNRWNCGAGTGRAGEKYLDSVLNYVCESDGRYFYAGCSEQATKGRFRNGNCGGNPNTDKHSLIPN